ncbi:LysR family transcriptional regulator [Dickeya zeae]|nr:LysR family transcriptional regulator [Dickeya zeae]
MNNIRRLDLNLLLTLDALLEEHNVTRAARRLNLSQPSVSVQLARLRAIFDDPLLLPGPRGMTPTARADALREPLRLALESLEQAIAPSAPFNPKTAENTWRISAFDYGESTILLPVMNQLRQDAPHTRLAILETPPSAMLQRMEQGDIDLALHTSDMAHPAMRRRVLFREHYVLAGRVGHPQLCGPLTLEQFSQLEHVIVSPDGGGFHGTTDVALMERGLTRKVVLSVPHFLFMMSVLTTTDLVAMLPSRLLRGQTALQVATAPIELPGFEMAMYWHERWHRDQAHQWLRGLIAQAAA